LFSLCPFYFSDLETPLGAVTMARSSRSSAKKFNNQRKAAEIFGPVESARAERLSQRLLDLAKQPKPETSDVEMNVEGTARPAVI
jgi:hypothetical protein